MKPIEPELPDGFHSDPGLVHFDLNIGLPNPDRFHSLFSGFHFHPGIEVSYPGRFHFNPDIEVPEPDGFHFYISRFHFDLDIEVGDPGFDHSDPDIEVRDPRWVSFLPRQALHSPACQDKNHLLYLLWGRT